MRDRLAKWIGIKMPSKAFDDPYLLTYERNDNMTDEEMKEKIKEVVKHFCHVIYGIRKDGMLKSTYTGTHEPDVLFERFARFAIRHTEEELSKFFDKLVCVKGDSVPNMQGTKFLLKTNLGSICDLNPKNRKWWCEYLTVFEGQPEILYAFAEAHGNAFIVAPDDSMDGERVYSCTIDLDKQTFIVALTPVLKAQTATHSENELNVLTELNGETIHEAPLAFLREGIVKPEGFRVVL